MASRVCAATKQTIAAISAMRRLQEVGRFSESFSHEGLLQVASRIHGAATGRFAYFLAGIEDPSMGLIYLSEMALLQPRLTKQPKEGRDSKVLINYVVVRAIQEASELNCNYLTAKCSLVDVERLQHHGFQLDVIKDNEELGGRIAEMAMSEETRMLWESDLQKNGSFFAKRSLFEHDPLKFQLMQYPKYPD